MIYHEMTPRCWNNDIDYINNHKIIEKLTAVWSDLDAIIGIDEASPSPIMTHTSLIVRIFQHSIINSLGIYSLRRIVFPDFEVNCGERQ